MFAGFWPSSGGVESGKPDKGPKTCCQGRSALGMRTSKTSPQENARAASAIRRSALQSPPPITLPARAVAILIEAVKKDLRQVSVTSSEQALLVE